MNAYDRRIIHTKLSEWRDVTTESEGEGENRALVIKPVKK
jgi:spoIIIJ-associated protein